VVVKNAEAYYRAVFQGRVNSWNLRDRHMVGTLDALAKYLDRQMSGRKRGAKIVVWAHNSHLGDARATEMGSRGEINIGQRMREHHGADAVLIGFTTYSGTVTAASNWGAAAERKSMRPALPDSYEALFHEVSPERFLLTLREDDQAPANLRTPRLERAIGVIYRPESERLSHYFNARLSEQFDAVIHFDQTRAVEPLELTSEWEEGEMPETFPPGI